MLTEPELIGLIALRSRLPELVGCGKVKPGIWGGVAEGIAPGKPAGRPGGGGWCGGGCCGVCEGVVDVRPAALIQSVHASRKSRTSAYQELPEWHSGPAVQP